MVVLVTRGKVGSKGELFPPKEVRDAVGLAPNRTVVFTVEGGRLVVEPAATLEELLRQPVRYRISRREFRKIRESLSREAERA